MNNAKKEKKKKDMSIHFAKIKEKLIDVCLSIRDECCKYSKQYPFLNEMACYYKEEKIQLDKIVLEDNWISYSYLFNLVFKLRDYVYFIEKIYKSKINKKICDKFDIYSYITFDKRIQREEFFDNEETIIAGIRCLTIAHPAYDQKINRKTYYYFLNNIKFSDEDEAITKALLDDVVSTRQNYIKFTVQRLDDKNSFDYSLKNHFSFLINSLFFVDYSAYLKTKLFNILSFLQTNDLANEREKNEAYNKIVEEKEVKNKIGKFIAFRNKESKVDIINGFVPFDVRYLRFMLKYSYDEKIALWVVNKIIFNYKNEKELYFDTRLFDKVSGDYKCAEYWLDNHEPSDIIDWDKASYDSINYNFEVDNERFVYYLRRFLLNPFTDEEIRELKNLKNYGNLYSMILKKEIALEGELKGLGK